MNEKNERRHDYRYALGAWFMVPKDFLRALKWDEALMLSYLANAEYVVRARERTDGWFYCKMSRITLEMGCSRDQQTRLIGQLTNRKLIMTKLLGMPAKRYFLIQWEAVERLLDKLPPIYPNEEDAESEA